MSTYLVNLESAKIAGYIQGDGSNVDINGMLAVSSAKDLEALSLQQLTDMYNAWAGNTVGKFKVAKTQAAEKTFGALTAIDLSTLVQLDEEEKAKVEDASQNLETAPELVEGTGDMPAASQGSTEAPAAAPTIDGPKVRKVRDSKLQRMKAAFLQKNEDGSFTTWTVKELMEKCGTTERITHVYISILRSPSDRFRIGIDKNKEKGTFVHTGLSTDPAMQ